MTYPTGLIPRFGGDKITFRATTFPAPTSTDQRLSDQDQVNQHLINQIGAAIEAYRKQKQDAKAVIEKNKEEKIKAIDEKYNPRLAELADDIGTTKAVPGYGVDEQIATRADVAKLETERAKLSEAKIKEAKTELATYHREVRDKAGWHWADLRKMITSINGVSVDEATTPSGGMAFVRSTQGAVLYTILFEESRFRTDPDTEGNVYTKIGYGPGSGKGFVRDSNGVMTRRYVTRAVLVYHFATMFGLSITAPPGNRRSSDAYLPEHLQRWREDVYTDPTVAPLLENGKAVAEQRPRYLGDTFDSHGRAFDLRRAAAYEPGGLMNPDFTPYRVSGTLGRAVGEKTGFGFVVGYNAGRSATDPMMGSERASMQVRNGSGGGQPYLSTASVAYQSGKVIRANKGERFDTGAENQATVVLDLSAAKKLGIDIVNQHAEESHRFKVAYDRLVEEEDLKGLQRKVADALLALQRDGARLRATLNTLDIKEKDLSAADAAQLPLVKIAARFARAGLRPRELGIDMGEYQYLLGHWDIVEQIMALEDTKNIKRVNLGPKRKAEDELDEYIYSARKNREVLMSRIPIACVVKIRLNPDKGKWPGLTDKFPHLAKVQAMSKDPVAYADFTPEVQKDLALYFAGTDAEGNNRYDRTKAMFVKAAKEKLEETNRT
jgi:hypothetical protein